MFWNLLVIVFLFVVSIVIPKFPLSHCHLRRRMPAVQSKAAGAPPAGTPAPRPGRVTCTDIMIEKNEVHSFFLNDSPRWRRERKSGFGAQRGAHRGVGGASQDRLPELEEPRQGVQVGRGHVRQGRFNRTRLLVRTVCWFFSFAFSAAF